MNFLNIGKEIDLKIEKLVNEGNGIGHYEGFAVFVNGVLPNETVKCKITSCSKNYAKAEFVEIVEPSTKRVKPFCPIFNACGGCQWQHISYEEQLLQKQKIVDETIEKISGKKLEVLATFGITKNQNYRQKIQFPVAQTKNSKRFLIGYYRENSHEIVNVKHCPIQPEEFNEIVQFIREAASSLEIEGYNEKKHAGELRHIVFRNSTSDKNAILTLVVNNDHISNKIRKLANLVFDKFANIKGVIVNFNTTKSNLILTDKFETVVGENFIFQKIGDLRFRISAGSFFQVNIEGAEHLLNEVKRLICKNISNPVVLDAYCGVGSFGLWLKDVAKEVWAVEQAHSSVEDAQENIKINNANNFKLFEGDVKNIFNEFVKEGKKFDVVVIDPPRKGCSAESLEQVCKLADKFVIYVSCNPATLARDLKYFYEQGFTAETAQPVDMFCHSHHVETVVLLEKK